MRETKEDRKQRQAIEEWQMVDLLRSCGNDVEQEATVTPTRRWRVDCLIREPERGKGKRVIALEIEGYGRHQSWAGWHADLEKYNAIAANGWLLVRVTRDMVSNGDALEALSRCGIEVRRGQQCQKH